MPDLYMDVDVGLSEVPVNIMALIDDTDFKSIEADVNYNAAGLVLVWHFTTTAGVYSQTAVIPTNTGGNYDWVEQGNGMFTIEIPASGGVSINNDTEGFGWFTGIATGILPWRGPVIGFRKASMNNVMIDNGTLQDNLEDMFDGTGYVGGVIVQQADVTKWIGTAAHTAATAGIPVVNLHSGGTSAGIDSPANFEDLNITDTTGLVRPDMANASGNYSGTVASVTTTTTTTNLTNAPTVGSLTAAMVLQVNAEVDTALSDIKLDHLVAVADNDDPVNNSIVSKLVSKDATADWSDYNNTTDSLEAQQEDILKIPHSDGTSTLNATALASINAEMVDVLHVDTHTEPAQGAPSVNDSIAHKIGWMYMIARNKIETTATLISVYDDAGTGVITKSTISDNGTTFSRGEFVAGA